MAPTRHAAHAPMWEQCLAAIAPEFALAAYRLVGDLRRAVAGVAAITGCYCLLGGSIYFTLFEEKRSFDPVETTSCGIACLIAAMNLAVFCLCIRPRIDKLLEYALCAAMAVFLVDIPLSILSFYGSIFAGSHGFVPFWLMFRIALCIPQLFLMYCLLLELRGDEIPTTEALLATDEHHKAIAHNDHPDRVVVAAESQ